MYKIFGAGKNFCGFGCSRKCTSPKFRIPTTVKVKEFWELLHKISRNIFENFENCIAKFRKPYQKISEDFEKYFGHFGEIISENFNVENNFGKILRNVLGSSRNITEIFKNCTEKFQKKILKILRIIAENVKNYFIKYREIFRKNLRIV